MATLWQGPALIDDKARGLHEGYLVTPTVQADALTASDDRWSQLHSASPASGSRPHRHRACVTPLRIKSLNFDLLPKNPSLL
jgi:hypothetical protein